MTPELKDRIKVGLQESRTIVLVVQVLIGFSCRAVFEPRFPQLPVAAQTLKLISFGFLVLALAMLLGVPAYHRIADEGRSTAAGESIMRRLMLWALLPFAAALGIDLAIAALTVLGARGAYVIGIGASALALFFWYGLVLFRRSGEPHRATKENMKEPSEHTPVEEKIKQLLIECRIVLPGTQAFLGFQLSAFLTEAFAKLSRTDQMLHLAALLFVALSGILLMTPPAYHRIAEQGQMTQRFQRLASALLLWAMVPLALGISLDFYVVLSKVTAQPMLSLTCATAALLTFAGFWFIFPILRRNSNTAEASDIHPASRAAAAKVRV